jgi:hypothetical protein
MKCHAAMVELTPWRDWELPDHMFRNNAGRFVAVMAEARIMQFVCETEVCNCEWRELASSLKKTLQPAGIPLCGLCNVLF